MGTEMRQRSVVSVIARRARVPIRARWLAVALMAASCGSDDECTATCVPLIRFELERPAGGARIRIGLEPGITTTCEATAPPNWYSCTDNSARIDVDAEGLVRSVTWKSVEPGDYRFYVEVDGALHAEKTVSYAPEAGGEICGVRCSAPGEYSVE